MLNYLAKHMGFFLAFAAITAVLLNAITTPALAHYLHGLVDGEANVIIPCKFKEIRRLQNGLYLVTDFATNVFRESFSTHLVDKYGKPVELKLPKQCTLVDAFFPPSQSADGLFDKNTILKIHNESGLGLCNSLGEFILPPRSYTSIRHLQENMFMVVSDTRIQAARFILFDAATQKRMIIRKEITENFEDGLAYMDIHNFCNRSGIEVYSSRKTNFDPPAGGPYQALNKISHDTWVVKKEKSQRLSVVDKEGIEKFSFPDNVISYEQMFEDLILCKLKNTRIGNLIGAFNLKGKFLWSHEASVIAPNGNGIAYFSAADDWNRSGFVTKAGEQIQLPVEIPGVKFQPTESQPVDCRMIKSIDEGFSHQDWLDSLNSGADGSTNRWELFNKLLREYDLIGMSRKNIEYLLGQSENTQVGGPSTYTYDLSSGFCANGSKSLQIEFGGNKVKRWKITEGFGSPKTNESWITINMVQPSGTPGLKPKYPGETLTISDQK